MGRGRAFVEQKTGMIYGTYRWGTDFKAYGKPPIVGLVLRPPGGFCRIEVVILGRAFYLTWGHEA